MIVADHAAQCNSENPTTNVVQFRPRPSALVHTEIARRGLPGDSALWRHLREWARHACIATEGDVRAWKVRPGEVYSREHPKGVAERLGVSLAHVWNVMSQLRAEGLIETRGCSPKRLAVVFLFAGPSAEGSGEGSGEGSSVPGSVPRQVPREDPRTGQPPPAILSDDKIVSESGDSDPANRHVCPCCGNDWPKRFGPKCFRCGFTISGSVLCAAHNPSFGGAPAPVPVPAAPAPAQPALPGLRQCAYQHTPEGGGQAQCEAAAGVGAVFCDHHAANGDRCENCQSRKSNCYCCSTCGATRVRDCKCRGQCHAKNRTGARCGNPGEVGSEWCKAHDPARAEAEGRIVTRWGR